MLKSVRLFLSVLVLVLGIYMLNTKSFVIMPYVILAMGILQLVIGSIELQDKRKTNAVISYLAAAFAFFVAIYTY